MRHLVKFATIFFGVVMFLMPLLECFDRWDPPGLSNDTEFPVFLITLFIALVLLALVAMARKFFDRQKDLKTTELRYEVLWDVFSPLKEIAIALFIVPPLRI